MLRVRDLMSPAVVSVAKGTSLHELARVLSDHAISGAPVVDEAGRVLGVVSESDIVDKERGPDEEPHGWSRLRGGQHRKTAANAITVGDAMTAPAIVVEPWMSAYEAAWLMSVDDVSRLPVVNDGVLVGVIARSDLVRYFARSDDAIAQDVGDELTLLQLTDFDVVVHDGHVVIRGEAEREVDLRCVRHAVSRVPGVVSVRSEVSLRRAWDGSASAGSPISAGRTAERA